MQKTKVALKKQCSEILNRHAPNTYLTGEDLAFIVDILCMHPEAEKKIGAGVRWIQVRTEPVYKRKCFYVIRTDGSTTDFSYVKAIDGATSAYQDFFKACRVAVSSEVISVAIQGNHIHHDGMQFAEIVNRFISEFGVDVSKVDFTGGDNVTLTAFVDTELARKFQEYHAEHATLVSIPIEEHKQIKVERFR